MLQANIDASITSGRNMFAGLVGDRMTAMRDSLSSLEECAGGKTDRESWNSGLNDDSTWEHVRREADYYLKRKQEQGPLHKHFGHRVPAQTPYRHNLILTVLTVKIMHLDFLK